MGRIWFSRSELGSGNDILKFKGSGISFNRLRGLKFLWGIRVWKVYPKNEGSENCTRKFEGSERLDHSFTPGTYSSLEIIALLCAVLQVFKPLKSDDSKFFSLHRFLHGFFKPPLVLLRKIHTLKMVLPLHRQESGLNGQLWCIITFNSLLY